MKTIYFNQRGSISAGGPTVFVYKTAKELIKRGYKVIYDNPQNADVAIAIIETGKLFRQIDRKKTKVILRVDGIYNSEYNKLFNRKIRPDMEDLHNKLKIDIPRVDWMVYQSQWSKDRVDEEIIPRNDKYSIIHNGSDIALFKPTERKDDCINLMHVGKMRDAYLMETLVGVYFILAKQYKIKLILAGPMDADCSRVFNANKTNMNVEYLGAFNNNQLTSIYQRGDIFIGVRQGSSSDNVISEAQASGLACVVSSWGGNAEMIKDGGVVVSTGHWDYGAEYNNKIAQGIETIISNLSEFKKNARIHAEKELSITNMVSKYVDIIERISK